MPPIPGLISCTGVTERWGLLSHAQSAVKWLACLIQKVGRNPLKASSIHAVVFHSKIVVIITTIMTNIKLVLCTVFTGNRYIHIPILAKSGSCHPRSNSRIGKSVPSAGDLEMMKPSEFVLYTIQCSLMFAQNI